MVVVAAVVVVRGREGGGWGRRGIEVVRLVVGERKVGSGVVVGGGGIVHGGLALCEDGRGA